MENKKMKGNEEERERDGGGRGNKRRTDRKKWKRGEKQGKFRSVNVT